jgi:HEPN domain-containing protein
MAELSDTAKAWFVYAKRDLDTAEILTKTMSPVPLEIVCYHCQQSAEKVLKGFLENNQISIKKTHDLGILVSSCEQINSDFQSIKENCTRLTDYGIQSRYPFAMEIEQEDMELALSDANKIWEFVKTIIK